MTCESLSEDMVSRNMARKAAAQTFNVDCRQPGVDLRLPRTQSYLRTRNLVAILVKIL